jgi:transcription antitermination factor NusG
MEKWGIRFGKMVPKLKPVDLIKSWKIVKGDVVQVITGKYAGQQGKVLRVQRDRNALIVEGINLVGSNHF